MILSARVEFKQAHREDSMRSRGWAKLKKRIHAKGDAVKIEVGFDFLKGLSPSDGGDEEYRKKMNEGSYI